MSHAAAPSMAPHRLKGKLNKGVLLFSQLLQGHPEGLLRVAAERLVPKLGRYRNRPWADRLRILLIRLQPGLRNPRLQEPKGRRDLRLILPSGWHLSDRERRRLKQRMGARLRASGAAMVTCDDWIWREGGGWSWREKPLWDGPLDQEVGIGEGPILLRADLANRVPAPPAQGGARWREAVHQLAAEAGGHAHVPLPLVRVPRSAPGQMKEGPERTLLGAPPLVSVLIPTAGFDHPTAHPGEPLLMNCLRTLLEKSHYRNLEVVVIDGGELEDARIAQLSALVEGHLGPGRWRFLRERSPYSYTTRMNKAAMAASGELLLQLNDDTELLSGEGVGALVSALGQPDVGIAGALLLYPDGRVQHAGTAIDNLAPRHAWAGCRPQDLPWGTLLGHRTFHAVTAAVCLCRRSLWQQLGGLSDQFPINYGDVDFCLRAADLGIRTVLAPRSRWIHFESVSRGVEVPPELALFKATWGERLGGAYSVDPYCSAWRELLAQPPPET